MATSAFDLLVNLYRYFRVCGLVAEKEPLPTPGGPIQVFQAKPLWGGELIYQVAEFFKCFIVIHPNHPDDTIVVTPTTQLHYAERVRVQNFLEINNH
jgi:hypothetical protein